MQVLMVTFGLDGVSEAEYYRGCDEEAQAFADVPGMIAKVWLADPGTNTYGGIYTFRDAGSLEDYLASDLFRSIEEADEFSDVAVQRFAALEGPTRITHGWSLQPA